MTCATCHATPPARNPYGEQVHAALAPDAQRPLTAAAFIAALPAALEAVEMLDADADGFTNIDELLAGTVMTDADSVPVMVDCDAATRSAAAAPAHRWDTCGYDPAFAFKRMHLDVCGRSPTVAETEAFNAADDWEAALSAALDECLTSPFWRGRDGALWNLANNKIRPLAATKAGENPGDIPFGDYDDDYHLFRYAWSGDRDAREVLTAQYMVAESADGVLSPVVLTPLQDFQARGVNAAQLVPAERRAGMITTRWFLTSQTMFTPMPRTTAAQAYRAFLGFDISALEGLLPVDGEPVDYDRKDVQAQACAVCHSTLDPLTYPFSRYDGLGGGEGGPLEALAEGMIQPSDLINPDGSVNLPIANYVPERLERFVAQEGPDIVDTPEAGVIFGQPVADLVEWAEVAANSDAFARATTLDFWQLFVGESPRPSEIAEFEALWQRFRGAHRYRVEAMLHDLVRTRAYGAP